MIKLKKEPAINPLALFLIYMIKAHFYKLAISIIIIKIIIMWLN